MAKRSRSDDSTVDVEEAKRQRVPQSPEAWTPEGATPDRPDAIVDALGLDRDVVIEEILFADAGGALTVKLAKYIQSTPGMSGRPDYYARAERLWMRASIKRFRRILPLLLTPDNVPPPVDYMPPLLAFRRWAMAGEPLHVLPGDRGVSFEVEREDTAINAMADEAMTEYKDILQDALESEPVTPIGRELRVLDAMEDRDVADRLAKARAIEVAGDGADETSRTWARKTLANPFPPRLHRRYLAIITRFAATPSVLPQGMVRSHQCRNMWQSIHTLCLASLTAAHAFYHAYLATLGWTLLVVPNWQRPITTSVRVNAVLSTALRRIRRVHDDADETTATLHNVLSASTLGQSTMRLRTTEQVPADKHRRVSLHWAPGDDSAVVPEHVQQNDLRLERVVIADDGTTRVRVYSIAVAADAELVIRHAGVPANVATVSMNLLHQQQRLRLYPSTEFGVLSLDFQPPLPEQQRLYLFIVEETNVLWEVMLEGELRWAWVHLDVWTMLDYLGSRPMPRVGDDDSESYEAAADAIAGQYANSGARREFVRSILRPYMAHDLTNVALEIAEGDRSRLAALKGNERALFALRYAMLAVDGYGPNAPRAMSQADTLACLQDVIRVGEWVLQPMDKLQAVFRVETSYDNTSRSVVMFERPAQQ